MIILVDAMGGDNAPEDIVNGSMDAINEAEGFDIVLVGDSQKVSRIINERKFDSPRLTVHHAGDVVTNEDKPTKAIRGKRDSSMVVAFRLLKENKGDVLLSAGNSGALMAGALFIVGRMKGVDRPSLPAIVPTKTGSALIIDSGLNTVCKPVNFLQFGIMGSVYMKEIFNVDNPKVGLINVGAEQSKGNDLIKQAHSLLTKSSLNFMGNIEGKDIMLGGVHVAVCDGFVGNVALKLLEGTAIYFFSNIKRILSKNFLNKIAAAIIVKDIKKFSHRLDADEVGGAPILGVKGLVIKSHGSSNAKTIKNVIINRAYALGKTAILKKLNDQFKDWEVEDIEP
ncbi:phosphate:acyl-[acyl carrier protein] acyltransferase [Anaerobacterium chartisolvens]|uniref:Phosphate acyltransferase n=1 Tax=Anaerobacterium chartisolvens TaxID=1297424 RepID=A0A369BF18_9FIRM|nr:phosphate acyltransferase PlsX [Anaerobacterium chartisolvens]RCX20021.1 phosphate:acyl-[acyl carrier protein] acyltransferase [Anaerobacterium chartisolvens]